MADLVDVVQRAASLLRESGKEPPRVGLVLGSGLGHIADLVSSPTRVQTSAIEGHPRPTVQGHDGVYVAGSLGGVPCVALRGRIHGYEGHAGPWLALPVRIFGALGCRLVVLTNAAGGINRDFRPGDLMLITDHLNLTRRSPLEGPNHDAFGPRFPDQSDVYPSRFRNAMRAAAERLGTGMRSGVYACVPGPEYETPAEIRMLRILGADAVGMSTVPEATAAAHMGMPVLGISLVSNAAAGMSGSPLSHDEVLEAAGKSGEVLGRILVAALPALDAAV